MNEEIEYFKLKEKIINKFIKDIEEIMDKYNYSLVNNKNENISFVYLKNLLKKKCNYCNNFVYANFDYCKKHLKKYKHSLNNKHIDTHDEYELLSSLNSDEFN